MKLRDLRERFRQGPVLYECNPTDGDFDDVVETSSSVPRLFPPDTMVGLISAETKNELSFAVCPSYARIALGPIVCVTSGAGAGRWVNQNGLHFPIATSNWGRVGALRFFSQEGHIGISEDFQLKNGVILVVNGTQLAIEPGELSFGFVVT
jgi:hypothetical protein